MYKCFVLFFSLLILATPVLAKHKKLKSGCWHTELQLAPSVSLPFKIVIEKEKQLSHIYIINAEEKIELREVSSKGDSIFISFSAFASELRAKVVSKDFIQGTWYNHAKSGNYRIPFWSRYEDCPRFETSTASFDVFGRWEVTFDYDDNPYKAVGLFSEFNPNKCNTHNRYLQGTFMTETGDYRFLEGSAKSDSLFLSTFDGSHAFLFTAKYLDDTLWGNFYSGIHYSNKWFAVKNDTYEITHPDSLTYIVKDSPISFTLKDLNQEYYNYPSKKTKGRVTLIQIMGTWCPNCLDESIYLRELCKKFPDQLEVIVVSYETQKKLEDKISQLKKYKEHLKLDYTFLVGGDACKSCAAEMFPMVNDIISFPTLIFIDKKGEIRKIHTGFNGPGTGNFYADFVESTDYFVKGLIEEEF